MNGAESMVRTLVGSGVEVCFANPGTSEMHFVAALDQVPGMRPVLGLFEGVVTGMADGYGRMAGKPAATLLHLGPGLGNGLANLHNARRANSPVVNVVGDHATYHGRYDAPLTSDIAGIARPVSGWVHTATSPASVAADTARAVQAAMQAPHQVATLILPADVAWGAAERPAAPLPVAAAQPVPDDAVTTVVQALRNGRRTAVLLGGAALGQDGLDAGGRIAAATGALVLCDTFTARLARGAGRYPVARIPYFAEQIVDLLKDVEQLVLVGTKPPVAFFAYPGKPSVGLPDGAEVLVLAHPHEEPVAALQAVVDGLGATGADPGRAALSVDASTDGRLDQFSVGRIIAAHLPDGAIVSDEAATSGLGAQLALATAAPHDHLSLTGGSIGQGLPVANGAAIACPDRKVVCLHGDGGAMYTVQSLWTQAREQLDVTTVIFANRSYAILNIELARVGAVGGEKALSMLDLGNPNLDWVHLANGMGVEAVRVDTLPAFADAFAAAMRSRGPRLIEVVL
ncbi:MAG: acetolactate synthase large subunit [Ilumatobacteraceae bacterium]|nr:acetolactate synthase large subunit [Ilumatobacter sp.]